MNKDNKNKALNRIELNDAQRNLLRKELDDASVLDICSKAANLNGKKKPYSSSHVWAVIRGDFYNYAILSVCKEKISEILPIYEEKLLS